MFSEMRQVRKWSLAKPTALCLIEMPAFQTKTSQLFYTEKCLLINQLCWLSKLHLWTLLSSERKASLGLTLWRRPKDRALTSSAWPGPSFVIILTFNRLYCQRGRHALIALSGNNWLRLQMMSSPAFTVYTARAVQRSTLASTTCSAVRQIRLLHCLELKETVGMMVGTCMAIRGSKGTPTVFLTFFAKLVLH